MSALIRQGVECQCLALLLPWVCEIVAMASNTKVPSPPSYSTRRLPTLLCPHVQTIRSNSEFLGALSLLHALKRCARRHSPFISLPSSLPFTVPSLRPPRRLYGMLCGGGASFNRCALACLLQIDAALEPFADCKLGTGIPPYPPFHAHTQARARPCSHAVELVVPAEKPVVVGEYGPLDTRVNILGSRFLSECSPVLAPLLLEVPKASPETPMKSSPGMCA